MSEWNAVLEQYQRKERDQDTLYPFWQAEVSRLGGINLADHPQQGDPLFQHKWSPADAAQHLRVVWMIKRWPVSTPSVTAQPASPEKEKE